MCTVTMLRTGGVLRVVCNRDESRQRPDAHPPFIARAGRQLVLTPQDPQGGGTWVAANSAGLVFTLLNAYPGASVPAAGESRGLIIPAVWDCASLDAMADRVGELQLRAFAPCRLLVADDYCVLELPIGAASGRIDAHALDRPLLFTSSSLGDALVHGPRRTLFEQMLTATRSTEAGVGMAARQDAFHTHRWRDRPAVSVHMSRPDACTVSTTVVEASESEIRMIYRPVRELVGTPVGLVIDRHGGGDAAAHRARGEHAAV